MLLHFHVHTQQMDGTHGVYNNMSYRWYTMHGFSINVNCDMGGFEKIVPCGLTGKAVGSISEWHPDATVAETRKRAEVQPYTIQY